MNDLSGGHGVPGARALPSCVRHPDRPTGLRCTRCDRPACPECLHEAAVGYQCVDCVNEGRRHARSPVTISGSRPGTQPIIVPLLILLNVGVFAYTAWKAESLWDNKNARLFGDWSLFPPKVADGEWWRIFTAGFLHIGPIHLAVNMIALWLIGRDMELVLGRMRFLSVYVLSLVGGSAAVFALGAKGTSVAGASGAVFGLMGGLIVVLRRLRMPPGPALSMLAINLVISVTVPNISLLGHLGGLLIGGVVTAAMVYAPPARRTPWQLGTVLAVSALVALVIVLRMQGFGDVECFGDFCRVS